MDFLPLHTVSGIVERFPREARAVRLQVGLRLLSFPWHRAEKLLPKEGRFLDVASGEGAWAHFLAVTGADRRVDGLELRKTVDTVRLSDGSVDGRTALTFVPTDLFRHRTERPYDGLTVMGRIPASPAGRWPVLTGRFFELLSPGGILLVRLGALPRGLGRREARDLLEGRGFSAELHSAGPLYPWDGLLLGRKPKR